jgi:hypothetical protein
MLYLFVAARMMDVLCVLLFIRVVSDDVVVVIFKYRFFVFLPLADN